MPKSIRIGVRERSEVIEAWRALAWPGERGRCPKLAQRQGRLAMRMPCTHADHLPKVVKATFAKGAQLKDPSKLFNSSLEGHARRAIDLHEGDKINASAFKALVRDAEPRYHRHMSRSYGQRPMVRSLEIVGERWTLLIVRDLLRGPCKFQDLVDSY